MAENNAKATEQKESTFQTLVYPVLILVIICLVSSVLLAVLNDVTVPIIEENTRLETLRAYLSVLPEGTAEDDLQNVEVSTANVSGAVKTADGMAVVKATAAGYSGNLITVYAAFDSTGTTTAALSGGALRSRRSWAAPLTPSAGPPSPPARSSAPSTARSTATTMNLRGWLNYG